jgi:hypothetical protein
MPTLCAGMFHRVGKACLRERKHGTQLDGHIQTLIPRHTRSVDSTLAAAHGESCRPQTASCR